MKICLEIAIGIVLVIMFAGAIKNDSKCRNMGGVPIHAGDCWVEGRGFIDIFKQQQ